MKQLFFTPGPSALYFTVEEHLKTALREQVPSLSHRSAAFQGIFEHTTAQLRQLLGLPQSWSIYFTSSATEIWDRIIENTVSRESFHLINGAFSLRFAEQAEALGRETQRWKVADGEAHNIAKMLMPESAELIALTHNETSTGVSMQMEDLAKIRRAFPDQLIALDIVSSVPYPTLDWSTIDTAYFSVQKAFGLPAGLGVWLVNERMHEVAEARLNEGHSIGSYHALPELRKKAEKNQTPETPNVLGIYLLGKVAEDMNLKGMDRIRKETEYKASLLYHTLSTLPGFSPFVEAEAHRSKTVIVANTDRPAQEVIGALKTKSMVVGAGYGEHKEGHIRIANFPTHSKEQIELLVDNLTELFG